MTREEATKIFRKEIECMSHSKCEDCILEKVCDPMRTTPFDSEYIEAYELAIKAFEYDDAKYHEEHGEVVVDKGLWEDAKKALEQEPKYCDRNICLKNEYNGMGCEECEVTKSQEPCEDTISKKIVLDMLDDINAETEGVGFYYEHYVDYIKKLPSVNPQEPKWNRLYNWLNDMRFGIAPDETVTDIDERNVRTAQVDLLDEIMEWMVEPQERSDKE